MIRCRRVAKEMRVAFDFLGARAFCPRQPGRSLTLPPGDAGILPAMDARERVPPAPWRCGFQPRTMALNVQMCQCASIQYQYPVPVQVPTSIVTETGNWGIGCLQTYTLARLHTRSPLRLCLSVSFASSVAGLGADGPSAYFKAVDERVELRLVPIPLLTLRG